jgi:3-oxoacyl-[acyl-carrier protein] reductase
MSLKDKTVLITGGSLGIGKAIAQFCKEKGAKVAITGRNQERLQNTAKELGVYGIQADVSQEADVVRTYQDFIAKFGKLDVLVNNAGLGRGWYGIEQLDLDDMKFVYGINVFGTALMTREAAKLFKKQNSGDIVNIASTAALKGYKNGTIYASSKFALRGMTECWRAELRPHNVRVFLINPSEVTTAFQSTQGIERPEETNKLRSEEIAHAVCSALEMDGRGFIPELTVWATNPF